MSDFLTHLVQRALSPTAEVRPRFPSRFETAPSPVPFADADFANEEKSPPRAPAQTATRFAEAPGNSAATTEQNIPRQAASPTQENLREANAPVAAAPRMGATPSPSAARGESPVAVAIAPRDSTHERAGELPRGTQSSSPQSASPPDLATTLSPEKISRAAPTANRISTPPNPARAEPGSILPPSPEPPPHEAAARPAAFAPPPAPPRPRKPLEIHATKSPAPRTAESAAARAPAPRVASTAPVAEAPGPPPIHVTIGRLEIRATTPPAPPRPAAPTPARMGLDDYLHRARGGRR